MNTYLQIDRNNFLYSVADLLENLGFRIPGGVMTRDDLIYWAVKGLFSFSEKDIAVLESFQHTLQSRERAGMQGFCILLRALFDAGPRARHDYAENLDCGRLLRNH